MTAGVCLAQLETTTMPYVKTVGLPPFSGKIRSDKYLYVNSFKLKKDIILIIWLDFCLKFGLISKEKGTLMVNLLTNLLLRN